MKEREIEQKESLEIIEEMIKTSKNEYNPYGGWHMLSWGYIVFFTSMIVAVLYSYWSKDLCHLFWLLIPLLGGISSFLIKRKEKKVVLVKGYLDKMINSLSLVINISIFTVMIGAYLINMPVLPLILLLSSVHCATIGLVTRYPLMTITGISGIFTSMLFYIIPFGVLHIYLFGLSYLLLMCIPAHCLIYQNNRRRA